LALYVRQFHFALSAGSFAAGDAFPVKTALAGREWFGLFRYRRHAASVHTLSKEINMICRQTVRSIVGLAVVAVLSGANVTRGAFTVLTDNDESSANAKYKVDPNPAMGGSSSTMIAYTAADVVDQPGTSSARTQQGTLKITDTFMDCTAHELVFMQNATPMGGFTAGGGLRLQMEFMITNQSGKPWKGFWIKTMETVPPNTTTVSGSHQHQAHFHPNDLNNEGAPATDPQPPMVDSMMMGFTTIDVPDNGTMAEVKGGKQPSGKTFNTKGFFLHERNLQNTNLPEGQQNLTRMFRLVLMPHCVPEPSSWLLMLLGGAAVAWRRRRR
jgi:hypothetical protein